MGGAHLQTVGLTGRVFLVNSHLQSLHPHHLGLFALVGGYFESFPQSHPQSHPQHRMNPLHLVTQNHGYLSKYHWLLPHGS
jgi:hypothetical protein